MHDLKCGSLEGADGPGGLFKKRQNVISLLSALSLLQAQGCQKDEDHSRVSGIPFNMIAFTVMVGFGIALFFIWANGPRVAREEGEPDAEPATTDPTQIDATPAVFTDSVSSSQPAGSNSFAARQPTAENYIAWLIERVERRYREIQSEKRIILYGECVTILHGLRSAMNSGHSGFKDAALRAPGDLADISDDEKSPNFAAINTATSLRDATRAARFIAGRQCAGRESINLPMSVWPTMHCCAT